MAKMKDNPIVSVIIPTYNRAHLVGRAIQSVLNQTYRDFEIIVVDDGSTDNTEEVVKGFGDKRIRYIRHRQNSGGSAAPRNTAIRVARGEYIAFQDSDDGWLAEKLEEQMKVFKTIPLKVGVVYTGFWRIKNNKKIYMPLPWVTQKEGNIHNELLKGNFVTTQAAVVRKECFKKAGMFDESLPRYQDWELWIKISRYYCFKYINQPLLILYHTSDSISSNQDALIKARKVILEKYFEDIREDKKVLAYHYLGIGTGLCVNGEIKEGEDYFTRALNTYPEVSEDRKLLSNYYFNIGISLCLNNNFRRGRVYLIKAAKAYPFNLKFLLTALISFFGQTIYNKTVKICRKIKNTDKP